MAACIDAALHGASAAGRVTGPQRDDLPPDGFDAFSEMLRAGGHEVRAEPIA